MPEQIDVGGHRLRADRSGSGPPHYLCLHGLVDALEIWDRVRAPLAERGEVIRIDQRAHGESGFPEGPVRLADLAADAVAVLDALGVGRAALVGHSMGGIVSMATALLHPDRVESLVLIGTASHCNERTADWYERLAQTAEKDGSAGLARAIYGKRSEKRIRGDARGIAQVTRALKELYTDPLTPKLGAIRCPALLLVGSEDPMGPKASENIAAELPHAKLEVLPGRGHWIHVEAPDALVAALDRWREAAD